MRTENGYYIWNKGELAQLDPHNYFHTNEFACRCTYPECKEQRISTQLVDKLVDTRIEHRGPLVVTNGWRCKRHQADLTNNPNVETVTNSQHTLGNAADIASTRYHELGLILPNHFKAIGTGVHGYHVDLRADRLRRWTYTKGL